MAWIESHQELREHPKTKRLCRVLALPRPMVVGYLHFLWWWAYDYAPEGDLSKFTDEDIADAVDWEGDPGAFVDALVQSEFIDADRRIHDWGDFAQKWIERRRADRERKRAVSKKAAPVQQTSDGRPTEIHSQSGVTGPDRTGPDRTGPNGTSPQPPPPAEGEAPPAPRKRGERPHRRGRANGAAHRDEPPEPVELTPVTPGDIVTWNQARTEMATNMSPGNASQVAYLVPIGRAPDGGLHLRAPPGLLAGRFRNHVARALLDAGDAAAAHVVIVEARPGSTEG